MDWLATSETEAEHQCAEVRLGDNVGRDCNAELAQSTSIAYSDPVPISPIARMSRYYGVSNSVQRNMLWLT
jgi:hypothetical protein